MYGVVDTLDRWEQSGISGAVARTVTLRGLGARTDAEALAISSAGEVTGSLLAGAATPELLEQTRKLLEGASVARMLELTIGDREAIAAGLACGGSADVVLQPAASIGPEARSAFRDRRPVGLVTNLSNGQTLTLLAGGGTAGSLGSADLDAFGLQHAGELLGKGQSAVEVLDHVGARLFVESFIPQPKLLVVGGGILGEALRGQAALLGWQVDVSEGLEESAGPAAALKASDALVLLTHDATVDAPVLATALRGSAGYVGALGSRKTQSARRERLRGLGLAEDEISNLHGPVGLDIGASNPAETALSICAEIVAVRSGRSAERLTGSEASIHR